MAIKTGYHLKRGGNKSREIKLLQVAGESFQHRRHRLNKKNSKDNNIEKKQRLQQIINEEHNNDINLLIK